MISSSSDHDLGVRIDADLSMKRAALRQIRIVRWSLPTSAMKTLLYNSVTRESLITADIPRSPHISTTLATFIGLCLQDSAHGYLLLTSSELLICRVVDIIARLHPMVSTFGHRDLSPSAIVHIRLQALTCETVFSTGSLHCSLQFLSPVNFDVIVSLIIS